MPLTISIITAVYNRADTIGQALTSVQAQTWSQVEHVVIDGGSTDGTLEILRAQQGRIAVLVSEPDEGIYDALNKGLSHATCDVVGFLHSDDYFAHEGVLEKVAAAFADPAVEAVYGDLVYVNAQEPLHIVRYWKSRPYRVGLCTRGWMPAHPTFFARRSVYERFGGFDLDFPIQADFEMCLRLLDVHKVRAVYLPGVMVHMRTGGASNKSVRNIVRGNIEAGRACRKHGYSGGFYFWARKLGSKAIQFIRRPD